MRACTLDFAYKLAFDPKVGRLILKWLEVKFDSQCPDAVSDTFGKLSAYYTFLWQTDPTPPLPNALGRSLFDRLPGSGNRSTNPNIRPTVIERDYEVAGHGTDAHKDF
jgi:hypothetical protein